MHSNVMRNNAGWCLVGVKRGCRSQPPPALSHAMLHMSASFITYMKDAEAVDSALWDKTWTTLPATDGHSQVGSVLFHAV